MPKAKKRGSQNTGDSRQPSRWSQRRPVWSNKELPHFARALLVVAPAKAGVQALLMLLDSGFRRNDV